MSKKDTRIESPLAWDEYRNKPLEQALPIIYSHAQSTSATIREWYWQSIRRKRYTSLGFRSVTFVLLIIGTLFPILAGLGDSQGERLQYTQLGVVSLALAGLLQVADKVFGWSSGWLSVRLRIV
jgi:SMODS and SLOG-associating 2TM effector domain 2